MSDKRAFLVLGPESSGTRLLTRLFIAAGCFGDDGHVQRLDTAIADVPRLVWRRSLPHGGTWPDVCDKIMTLREHHYDVTALIMSRDWHAMSASQVQAGHVLSNASALVNIQEAYASIFHALRECGTRFEIVNYEALARRPQAAVAALMTRLELPVPADRASIYDGDAKYYGSLLELVDQEQAHVREAIEAKYGFTPPNAYVADLVSFLDEISREVVP